VIQARTLAAISNLTFHWCPPSLFSTARRKKVFKARKKAVAAAVCSIYKLHEKYQSFSK
jgi:hypothetical protein